MSNISSIFSKINKSIKHGNNVFDFIISDRQIDIKFKQDKVRKNLKLFTLSLDLTESDNNCLVFKTYYDTEITLYIYDDLSIINVYKLMNNEILNNQ